MKAQRKRLTKAEFKAMWDDQNELCGCGCGLPLSKEEGTVQEHTFAVALGNGEKPDAIYRKPCADKKTYGPRGDLTVIARTKRYREARTQFDKRKAAGGSRIKSRGFDKSLTKKMNGEVVKNGR